MKSTQTYAAPFLTTKERGTDITYVAQMLTSQVNVSSSLLENGDANWVLSLSEKFGQIWKKLAINGRMIWHSPRTSHSCANCVLHFILLTTDFTLPPIPPESLQSSHSHCCAAAYRTRRRRYQPCLRQTGTCLHQACLHHQMTQQGDGEHQ